MGDELGDTRWLRLSLTPPYFPFIAVALSPLRQSAGLAQLVEQLICNQ